MHNFVTTEQMYSCYANIPEEITFNFKSGMDTCEVTLQMTSTSSI